jgi:hypothetical protein
VTLRAFGTRLAAAPPRTRALLVAGAGAAALLLAASGDPLLATAGRATAAALALGGLGWWLRRRGVPTPATALIDVAERRPLSRDAAVALLHVRGRALLVGYGADGVRLLADLGAAGGEEGP